MDFLPKLAGDISVIFAFLVAAVVLGVVFGRTKLLAIMIDVYIARALVAVIPNDWIAHTVYADLILFGITFVFLLLIDHRLFDLHLSQRGSDFFWRVGVMSVLVTGMFVSTLLNFLPKDDALGIMSKSLYTYFVSDGANLFWMLVPLIVLSFINQRFRD